MTLINKRCSGHLQSNPAVKIFVNADDKTTARTSYPSSINESKTLAYAWKNSDENALIGSLLICAFAKEEKRHCFAF